MNIKNIKIYFIFFITFFLILLSFLISNYIGKKNYVNKKKIINASEYNVTKSYFVDKNNIGGYGCDDNWIGIIEKPFCTIGKALLLVGPGEGIFIRGGNYDSFLVDKSGSDGKQIVIVGYNPEKPKIDGGFGIKIKDGSFITIGGFELTNTTGSWKGGITISNGNFNIIENNIIHDISSINVSGIWIENGSNNKVLNNQVSNTGWTGIYIKSTGNNSNNEIAYNKSSNNILGQGNSDGIGLNGVGLTNNNIHNNIVYGNSDDGVDVWNTSQNLISANIAYNQQGSGDGNGIKAGGSTTGGNNIIVGNISYNNKSSGFDSNGSGGNKYYNNDSFKNGHYGFNDSWKNSSCTPISCKTTYINNIGFNNVDGNLAVNEYTETSHNNIWFSDQEGASVLYKGHKYVNLQDFFLASGFDNPNNSNLSSIQLNPQFVNTQNSDFHLLSSSPAIDKGDPANSGLINPIYNNVVDIGAYEFISNTTITVTPSNTPTATPTAVPTNVPINTVTPTPTVTIISSNTPTPTSASISPTVVKLLQTGILKSFMYWIPTGIILIGLFF